MKVNRREAIGAGIVGAGLLGGTLPAAAKSLSGPAPSVGQLRVCGLDAPLTLGALPPRLSWLPQGGVAQAAYRVTVARTAADLAAGRALLWDSGKVQSADVFDVAYGGPPLGPRAQAAWQVEVWPAGGGAALRSTPAAWETGLGDAPEWQGRWLAAETETARLDRLAGLAWVTGSERQKVDQSRFFRLMVDSAEPADVEFLFSAHKVEGVWFNGAPVTVQQDGPVSWVQMATCPLRLNAGRNVIALAVSRKAGFGVPPPCLATILRHGPGLSLRRTSAEGWRTTLATAPDWTSPAFDDSGWEAAVPATGTLPIGEPYPPYPATQLRRAFTLAKPVAQARLYATALGFYEPWLNGAKVGTQRLAPESTDPSRRMLYQGYDVTRQLKPGANVLGLWVADGWYGGKYSTSVALPSAPRHAACWRNLK